MTEQELLQNANNLQNLHYFFSTAPQVLGAILAITGAFVVLRKKQFTENLDSHSQRIIDYKDYTQKNQLEEDIKNIGCSTPQNLSIEKKIDKLYFGENHDALKYAQIGGRRKEVTDII
jgi:hypothetical protein